MNCKATQRIIQMIQLVFARRATSEMIAEPVNYDDLDAEFKTLREEFCVAAEWFLNKCPRLRRQDHRRPASVQVQLREGRADQSPRDEGRGRIRGRPHEPARQGSARNPQADGLIGGGVVL